MRLSPQRGPRDARTLRATLLRWLLIPLSLLLIVDALGSHVIARRLADRVYDGELLEIARELALHVHPGAPQPTFDLEKDAERTLLLDQYDKVEYVVRAGATPIAGDPNVPPPARASGEPAFYDATVAGDRVRVAAIASTSGGVPVTIAVAETRVKRESLVNAIMLGVILPQLLLIVIAGMALWIGVARGLAPLGKLQQAVAARSHVDLSPIEVPNVPAEVRPLLVSINELMTRLHEILSFQTRFIADAAHQLRTPVAGLKAHVEVALREEDPTQARASIAHLYTAVERMSRLVAQLLSLARNEPTTVRQVTLAPLDLAKLVFDVTMEWVPEAYRRNIDLGFDGAAPHVTVEGDAPRLTELVNNLLDNAIRYSREGGRVTVHVAADPPRLSVSDDGPLIPVDERDRIFERFHRLLGSHAGGSGLGLAIVQEIAKLHGASISLGEDSDGLGNRFTVTFPAARALAT
ncbi:MAG TPA: sensor histidine kinase N-terminal domain-containing protein [Casimicrobiaceae bacterium]|nr:sensor histidine kinase N-terminal domain-containing protein [Casimicrobiaceae bacterium]